MDITNIILDTIVDTLNTYDDSFKFYTCNGTRCNEISISSKLDIERKNFHVTIGLRSYGIV